MLQWSRLAKIYIKSQSKRLTKRIVNNVKQRRIVQGSRDISKAFSYYMKHSKDPQRSIIRSTIMGSGVNYFGLNVGNRYGY